LNLDVGCGNNPRGDINVDVFKHYSPEIIYRKNILINVDIQCDGCYLPFRNNVFNNVTAYRVLEHTEKPLQMLNELLRVAKNRVIVYIPYFMGRSAKSPEHKFYFSILWFSWFLRGYSKKIRLLWKSVLRRKLDFPIKIPSYLFIEIKKR